MPEGTERQGGDTKVIHTGDFYPAVSGLIFCSVPLDPTDNGCLADSSSKPPEALMRPNRHSF